MRKMDGTRIRKIRLKHELTATNFARALGYRGDNNGLGVMISRLENDKRKVTPMLHRLLTMFERHEIPKDFVENGENTS